MTRSTPSSSLQGLAWGCAAAAVIGFFLPWAQLDIGNSKVGKEVASSVRKSLGKTFKSGATKEPSWIRKRSQGTPAIPTAISGFQIPQMANRRNVKVMAQLVKLFTKSDDQLGWKSYAVYLLPGLALLCAWLLSVYGSVRLVALGVLCGCAAVAGAGFWKLLTADTKAQFAMAIGPGLWLSLWAYVGLSVTAGRALAPP